MSATATSPLLEQLAPHQYEAALEPMRQERDRLRLEAHLKLALDAAFDFAAAKALLDTTTATH